MNRGKSEIQKIGPLPSTRPEAGAVEIETGKIFTKAIGIILHLAFLPGGAEKLATRVGKGGELASEVAPLRARFGIKDSDDSLKGAA